MLSMKWKVRFLYGRMGLYSRSGTWHEMAERTSRHWAVGTGLGCKWAHWRQRPVFYLRCLENHGAALRIDFCNLLYSKLFSARARKAHFRSFSWDLGEHHLRSAGNSDPLLPLLTYPAVRSAAHTYERHT